MKIDNGKFDVAGKLKNGVIAQLFKDGSVCCSGEWIDGERTGEWKYFYVSGGLKAVGLFSKGRMSGEWSWYHEDGKLMQTGSFDADEKKSGAWKRYDLNGKLQDEREYIAGKEVRAKTKTHKTPK